VALLQQCECIHEKDAPSCTAGNTCAPTLYCIEGLCRASCSSAADCPAVSTCDCANPVEGVCGCTDPCAPFPDTCPEGTACTVGTNGPECTVRCSVPQGYCTTDGDCLAGTTCNGGRCSSSCPSSGSTCTSDADCPLRGTTCDPDVGCQPVCRVGEAGDCAAGTTCVGFLVPRVIGGVTYGACRTDCHPGEACAGGLRCVVQNLEAVPFTDCLPERNLPAGASCNDDSECPVGQGCRVHALDQRSCEPYCSLPGGACPAGSTCTPFPTPLVLDGVTYGTCMTACDPLSASGCGTGASCNVVYDTPGGAAATDCVLVGAGTGVFGCYAQLCVPGTQCTEFGGGTTACEAYCQVGQPNACPAGFACAALVPPASLGAMTYGLCQDVCNLATPADVCGPGNATCLVVLDGSNPPHTACGGLLCPSSPPGGPCNGDADCTPGATCRQNKCLAWCEMGPNEHCPGGTTCVADAPPLVIDGVTYGTCQ
jgi:hypothetical protein